MLDITKDIQSLTTFRRRSSDFLKQLKKSKRPVVLTVKGKAAAIVQDAEAYQRLLDIAASADAGEGIRQGLDDVANGRTRPARAAFDEIYRRGWTDGLPVIPPKPEYVSEMLEANGAQPDEVVAEIAPDCAPECQWHRP